jgi:anaphase-promoting complex subunit 6
MSSRLLDKARSQARLYASRQLHNTAIYWADKALSLSGGEAEDLATLASYLHASGQHRRAAHALRTSPLLPRSAGLRYLAAKCYLAVQEWEEALLLLRPGSEQEGEGDGELADSVKCEQLGDVTAASLLVQGQAHEALGSLQEAVACYREALQADLYCEEALERLSAHHALSGEEEKTLLSDLPLKKQCSPEEERMVVALYQAKLRHASHKTDPVALCARDAALKPLATNSDVVWSAAHRLFRSKNIHSCYEITSRELQRDPFHPALLLLHLLCCVEKRKSAELFALGHRLVGNAPSSPLAWFAVSCYYLSAKNHQNTRKYLTKVLGLDENFGPAHLAFGLSFATEGEHDQAISAFSRAARVMRGSHLPLMELGREYHATGASATAVRFMKSALSISPEDPSLLQEIGVMLTNAGNHEKAAKYFLRALSCLRAADPHMTVRDWEPVYNNLAHVYRKLNRLDQSLQMHHRALTISPKEPTTLTAIAFVHLLKGDLESAIDYCSRSLLVRREDPFTIEVLKTASEELISAPLVLSGNESLDSLEPENEILEWGQQSGTGTKDSMQTD